VVDRGKIIALDSPAELIHKHFPEKAIEFKQAGPDSATNYKQLSGVKRVKQEEDTVIIYTAEVPTTITSLLQYSESAGIPLNDFIIRTATLEDVFLELTGRRLRE
jgi:ABC-2 type transport system ATP-binding protein